MTALIATLANTTNGSGGATCVVAEPAGLQAGELLLSQYVNFGGGSAPGGITGFTDVIASYGSTGGDYRVQHRVADGTEGPTYTADTTGSGYNDGIILRIIGGHATTPIDGSNSAAGNASSVNFPAVTTSADYCSAFAMLGGSVSLASAVMSPPEGWIPILSWGGISPNNYNAVFWRPMGLAGSSTGTANFAFGATSDYSVAVVTVAPASSSGIHFARLAGLAQNLTGQGQTPVDMPTAGSIAVGNHLIAGIAADNAGTNGLHALTTPTDSQSHSWALMVPANVDPGAANAGATAAIGHVKVANAFSNSNDTNINFSPNVTAKAIMVFEVKGLHASSAVAVSETQVTATSTTLAIARTPTATGQLVLAVLAIENAGTVTFTPDVDNTDGAWGILGRLATTSGTATSNQSLWMACKIVTGTTAQTWNPTIGTSSDIAAVMAVFDKAAAVVDIRPTAVVSPTAVSRASRW